MTELTVLAVTSEIFPLVKTGGLADVTGALPGALAKEGVSVTTLVPGYPAVIAKIEHVTEVAHWADLFGGPARLLHGSAADLDLLVLDAPHLFDRPGNLYAGPDGKDWSDNARRFASLGCVAALVARGLLSGYAPDIVHAHDWQAALGPVYLRFGDPTTVKSIITIHNLAFQGAFPKETFPMLGLPQTAFAIDGVEYYGGVGYLKGGLQCADAITTVSPTYAAEICTSEGGMGLDGLLRVRRDHLTGIVNGIDTSVWDPATDKALEATYGVGSIERRTANKSLLEQRLSLEPGEDLIYGVVTRLTWQKGMDVLASCLNALVHSGARLALIGTGDTVIEQAFRDAAGRHPGRVGVVIGYDERLAHLIQGGADAILVPSRFEPCGLTQLCGLRYGCVPVVSRVGGLADTVIDANDAALATNAATGVQFLPVDQQTLTTALMRTAQLYRAKDVWRAMQLRGMSADVSWRRSAGQYADLFRSLAAHVA
jgi:starch synthase